MTTSYRAQVATAFEELAEGLAPFVDARMSEAFPGEDWILTAATKLGKRRDVLVSLSDPHFQLEVINRWWGPCFAAALGDDARQLVTDLRTARNHWAHPDEDHPFDLDYAMRVHQAAEELLRRVGAPEADRLAELAEDLRWVGLRNEARSRGVSETEALMSRLMELEKEREELSAQLEEARAHARTAAGRQRAVARQLAELQSQYAAVSGLRDDYLALRRQLADGRGSGDTSPEDAEAVDDRLAEAQAALDQLQAEAAALRDQLDAARRSLATVDPMQTEAGRRWVWLMTALVLVMGIIVVLVAYVPLS
jgi:flagellar biosynthesis chaperone FliJ